MVALLVLVLIGERAFGAVEAEPNNTSVNASTLQIGEQVTGAVSGGTDVDYFRINVNSGTLSVTINKPAIDFRSVYYEILSESQEILTGGSLYQAESVTRSVGIGSPGAVYVRLYLDFPTNVSTVSYEISTSFSSTTEGIELEPNNTIEGATNIQLDTSVAGLMGTGNDVDYFLVDVNAGTLTVTVEKLSTDFGTVAFEVLDGLQQVLAGGVLASDSTSRSFVVTTSGSHYIRLYAPNSTQNVAKSYVIRASFTESVEGLEVEPNNTLSSANSLQIGDPVTGSLSNEADIDYFQLVVDEGTLTVTIDKLDPDFGFLAYKILDSSQQVLAGGDIGAEDSSSKAVAISRPGTYYIRISAGRNWPPHISLYAITTSFSNTTGNLEVEPNDTIERATSIPLDTPMQGSLSSETDVDFYQLNLESGALTMTLDMLVDDYDHISYEVLDSSQGLLAAGELAGAFNSSTKTVGISNPGIYYIRVFSARSHYMTSTNVYELTTTFSNSSDGVEIEFNDTVDDANSIEPGTSLLGSLSGNADIDHYQIQVGPGTLAITVEKLVDDNEGLSYEILSSTEEVLARGVIQGSAPRKLSSRIFGVASAETIYVRIWSQEYANYTGSYEITTVFSTSLTGGELEPNDTITSATTLEIGNPMGGVLLDNDDVDCFKLEMGAGTLRINVDRSIRDFGYLWYEVLNDSYETLASGTIYRAGTSTRSVGINRPGTYYIRVSAPPGIPFASSEAYEITTSFLSSTAGVELETNNSADDATPLQVDTPTRGSLSSAIDFDFFSFSTTAGTLTLHIDKLAGGNDYLSYEVFNGPQIIAAGKIGGDRDPVSSTKTLGIESPTTLYFRIYSAPSAGQTYSEDYELSVSFSDAVDQAEAEPNNTTDAATITQLSAPVFGSLAGDSDMDYFTFSVGPGIGTIEVSIDKVAESGGLISYEVLSESLEVLASGRLSAGPRTVTFDANGQGTYYVRVFSDHQADETSTGQYELSVTYFELRPQAPTLQLDTIEEDSVNLVLSADNLSTSPLVDFETQCEIPALQSPEFNEASTKRTIILGMPSQQAATAHDFQGQSTDSSIQQQHLYLANPELATARLGDKLFFNAPDGSTISAVVSSAIRSAKGNLQIEAKADGVSMFIVVNADGNFFSSITSHSRKFQSLINYGETHVYSRTEGGMAENPFVGDLDFKKLSQQQAVDDTPTSDVNARPANNQSVISLGIVVDELIHNNFDVYALVDYYVGITNRSFRDSGVDLRLEVVGITVQNPYLSLTDMYPTLNWITCGSTNCSPLSGTNQRIRLWRDRVKADMVAQFIAFGTVDGTCGIAQLPTNFSHITERSRLLQFTYSVSALIAPIGNGVTCGDYVLAHELGHNFGLWHDRQTLAAQGWTGIPAPVFPYAHGYKKPGVLGTVMSYANTDERIANYSTPDIQVRGQAIGVPAGSPSSADSARAVRNVMGYYEDLYDNSDTQLFRVTTSASAGGVISPLGPVPLAVGERVDFSVIPSPGFGIASVTGCDGTLFRNVYLIAPVTTNCEVRAEFIPISWSETHTDTSVTFNDLPTGYDYSCSTAARNQAGTSAPSNSVSFSILEPTEPRKPVITEYDYGNGEIFLTVFADNGGTRITNYAATCSDGVNSHSGASSSGRIVVEGLTNDVAYTCQAVASNEVGVSPPSDPTPIIVPEALNSGLPVWLIEAAKESRNKAAHN